MMFVILIALFAILAFNIWLGFRRGLFRSLLGLVSVIVALAAAYLLMPTVRNLIIDKTEMDDKIYDTVYSNMHDILYSENKDYLKGVGYSDAAAADEAAAQTRSQMSGDADEETRNSIMKGLELPKALRDKLDKGNTDKMWKKLGVNNFFDYTAKRLTNMLVNLISAVIVYILARIALFLICRLFYGAINKFMIVYAVDHGLGMVFGVAMGLLFVWVAMAVFALSGSAAYAEMTEKFSFMGFLDQMNPIARLILK